MDELSGTRVGWRSLAEAIPGGVGVQVDGEFVYVSETMAATVGRDGDELVGESWRTLFDEPEAARLERTAFERLRADGEWKGVVVTGGRTVPETTVELSLATTDPGAVVWTVTDCDRRVEDVVSADSTPERARQSLPGSVRTALDAIDDVLLVLDEDGESVLWNQTLVETTGHTHDEVETMHVTDLVPADRRECVPGLVAAVSAADDRRVEVDLLTSAGERITHEFGGTTFEDPATGRIFRCCVGRDVGDRRERERRLERYETIIETVTDGVYTLDERLRFSFVNEGLCEMLGESREDLLGTPATEYIAYDEEVDVAAETRRRVVEGDTSTGTVQATTETDDGERSLESRYRLYPAPDGQYRGSIGVIRDVTEREEREGTLERQRDELATLDRINELLLETVKALVETASRDAVERTICERLAASDLYQFAWVAEPELDGDGVVPRTAAGDADGYLDEITVTDDGSQTGLGPLGRALETGEVQVNNVDDPAFDPWREPAAERGFQSAAAVPLQHGETVYGALVVYATREDAFSEREAAGFDVLGRTVGFVIHAGKSRDLLFADAVVELEFRLFTPDSLVVGCAAELGCELTLDGYVSSGEQWILYLTVEDATPERVVETVTEDPRVDRARLVTEETDDGRIELVMDESSFLHTVTDAGATVATAVADPDGARVVAEAPAGTEVREVVELVQSEYPDSELRARRERDRDVTTGGPPASVVDGLTDRQREAIAVAYQAGYFEWPRESTAEEVADSIGLSGPTFHGHLRKAENAILSAILDEEWPDPPPDR